MIRTINLNDLPPFIGKAQLAQALGISRRTLQDKVRPIRPMLADVNPAHNLRARYYTRNEVEVILIQLGVKQRQTEMPNNVRPY